MKNMQNNTGIYDVSQSFKNDYKLGKICPVVNSISVLSEKEFNKRFISSVADCYSENSNDSLKKHGHEGYRIVSHISCNEPSIPFKEFILVSTYRPGLDKDKNGGRKWTMDCDPIFHPLDSNNEIHNKCYRIFDGAGLNPSMWSSRTLDELVLNNLSSLIDQNALQISSLSVEVPALSNFYGEQCSAFGKEYQSLSLCYK